MKSMAIKFLDVNSVLKGFEKLLHNFGRETCRNAPKRPTKTLSTLLLNVLNK